MADLRPGDVILVRSSGLIPSLIRFGERVRYQGWPRALGWLAQLCTGTHQPDHPADPWYVSHAAVVVDGGQLIEAQAKGLATAAADKYDGTDTVIVLLADLIPDVTDVTRARVTEFARDQLGRHGRYGWLSIASIIVQLITPVRLDISWDGALICSAFAGQCLEHAGFTLTTRSSLTTTPADLRAMAGGLLSIPPTSMFPTPRSQAA